MSGAIVAVASGLMATFSPHHNSRSLDWISDHYGLWAWYGAPSSHYSGAEQFLKERNPIVNALVVFAQNLGGAIFLSIAQLIFSSRLRHGLQIYAPEVDVALVIEAGATGLRSGTAVPEASLPGVLIAYSKSFDSVMYLSIGVAGGAFIFAFGMGWVSTKKPQTTKLPSEPGTLTPCSYFAAFGSIVKSYIPTLTPVRLPRRLEIEIMIGC